MNNENKEKINEINDNSKGKTVYVRIPALIDKALAEIINKGIATNQSEFIRSAIADKLDKFGILTELLEKQRSQV